MKPGGLPPEITDRETRLLPAATLDLQAHEEALIRRARDRFNGNRQQSAEALNISTVTLWRKMKQYGLAPGRVQ